MRTLIFQTAAILILPLMWGLDGIWISTVVAEVMAVIVTATFMLGKRKTYNY